MDWTGFDFDKEIEKYKDYLSSCLKTPTMSEKEQEELKKVMELLIQNERLVLTVKKKIQ